MSPRHSGTLSSMSLVSTNDSRVITVLLAVMLTACGDDDAAPVDGGAGDSGDAADTRPRIDIGPIERCRTALPVDMIWVIDNSNSMEQEQNNLAINFPALIDALTNPPDEDEDGEPDFPPLMDLRIGVVSTDLGVGANEGVIGCDAGTGEAGEFVSEARAEMGACVGVTTDGPSWLQFDGTNADAFDDQFACIGQLGTDGCGLEQQLESSLLAVEGSRMDGHVNSGFLRTDSLVAIVYVTDEDDCSATDDAIFSASPAARDMYGPYARRCAEHPELLHPINRYVSAFRALALDRAGDVIVAAITGVPDDLTADPRNVDYAALLADPRMQYRPDPEEDTQLAPACSFGGVGSAVPARRIVEVVRDFGEDGNALLASICQPDLSPTLRAIAQLVSERLCEAPI